MQDEYRSYHLYIILLLYRKGFFFFFLSRDRRDQWRWIEDEKNIAEIQMKRSIFTLKLSAPLTRVLAY